MSSRSSRVRLFVDGYNVIGQWATLQTLQRRDGLETAREELVRSLLSYSAFRELETHVIFDAQNRKERAKREPAGKWVWVHYTEFGQTADTYIELACATLHREGDRRQRVRVATSDRAQQLVAIGYGAEWMSSLQLVQDVQLAARQIQQARRAARQPARPSLAGRLDEQTRRRLAQLRYGR